ncbi:MAG: TnsA endonuclease N-terminal domain-containing protein [Pyrinomonadaceae bacterium]
MVVQLHETDGFWEQTVRKITNKGTKKCIGKFPSVKAGRNIWYESTIERDFIYLLEFDPDVVLYKEQPFRVKYTFDGKRRSYVPDFFVQRGDKFQVIDNKPAGKAITAANKLRYRIFKSIFREQGYEFIVATDLQIRVGPLLGNVKTFWRYSRTPVHPLQEVRCQEYLSERQEASIQELADALAPHGVTLQVVYALLYRGVLATDMRRPVDPEAVVYFSSVGTPAYARIITKEA